MSKNRGINRPKFAWREEVEVAMLHQHYADTPTAWLAQVFGCCPDQVYSKAKKLGLAKSAEYLAREHACRLRRGDEVGKAYRFPKGHAPANKGRKTPGFAPGRMGSSQFKKGHRPINEMPIGGYRINHSWHGEGNGVLEVKLTDLPGPYTNRWKPVHHLVWEQAHGPRPAGHCIAFKPGRFSLKPEEITSDALECITRAENAWRNKNGLAGMPKELADILRLRGQLTKAINRKLKESEQHE